MNNKLNYNTNSNINCENEFCIYQSDGKCILEKIELDNIGCCQSGIHVSLEEKLMKQLKQKQLSKFDQ